jgi:hypothetical protein
MRLALLAATAALLGGCQVVNLLLPTQQLTLINQTAVSVRIRVGEFKGSDLAFTQEERTRERLTLAPRERGSLQLPVTRYSVYAEADTDRGEAALTDVQLTRDRESSLVLNEKVEDRAGNDKIPGTFFRQLGWVEN